jgi:hypothetical protein
VQGEGEGVEEHRRVEEEREEGKEKINKFKNQGRE